MKKALAWFSKAQAEGVLDPEWVLDKPGSVEDKFLTGKTGVLAFQPQYILPRYTKLQAKFPEAKIAVLPSVQGEKYNYSFFASKEGQRLTSLGEEGVTYKVENGKMVFLDEQLSKLYNPGQLLASIYEQKLPVPEPVLEGAIQVAEGYGLFPNTDLLIAESELATKKMADLEKMTREMIKKIILGQTPINKYDDLVTGLKNEGIDKVLEELTTIY